MKNMDEKELVKEAESLLLRTATISDKHNEIARLTGANYNIFNVLRIKTKEVILHSRMIKDLLNPKGQHGQGDIFLELFLNRIKEKFDQDGTNDDKEKIDLEYQVKSNNLTNKDIFESFTKSTFIKVKAEETCGAINKDTETGGSIDIFLKTNTYLNTHLVIENKVDAYDQAQQLIRYSNSTENSVVFYLTRDGKQPGIGSIKSGAKALKKLHLENNKDFFCISYKDDILNWLVDCKLKISHLPHLRETLSQYINIVKQITNQNPNEMNIELAEFLFKNPQHRETLIELKNAFESPYYLELCNNKIDDDNKEISLKINEIINNISGLTFNNSENKELFSKYSSPKGGILLNYNEIKAKYFYPSFKFGSLKGYKDFKFSIRINDKHLTDKDLRHKLFEEYKTKNNTIKENTDNQKYSYIFSLPFIGFEDWENETTFNKINNGEFKKALEEKLKELIEVINKVEEE